MMLTVSQVAKRTGISPHTIRYYVKIGLLQPSRRPDNHYHLFSERDISRLQFIQNAQFIGFTLKEISSIFSQATASKAPCLTVKKMLELHLHEIQPKIDNLKRLKARMEKALEQWQDMPSQVPDGHSVCQLIESIERNTNEQE